MRDQGLIHEILDRLVSGSERSLLLGDGPALTGAQLLDQAARVANGLTASGVRPGDRIVLGLAPGPRFVAQALGILWSGACLVPLSPRIKRRELEHVLSDCRPHLALAEDETTALIRTLEPDLVTSNALPHSSSETRHNAPPVAGSDPALVLYTSGSTGRPKGVVHTHASLFRNLHDLGQAWEWSQDDELLLSLPFYHLHGLCVGLFGSLLSGGRIRIQPRFVASATAALLSRPSTTMFYGVPSMYIALEELPQPPSLSHLRLVACGSAPLSEGKQSQLESRLQCSIRQRYGTSETGIVLAQPTAGDSAGVGFSLPSWDVRLVAADEENPEQGELQVRGPGLFREYLGDPERTQATRPDGWYRTGDLVEKSVDGSYRVLGRLQSDIFKVRGHKIGALEIEATLLEHPRIQEAAVIALPHEQDGEELHAAVRCRQEKVSEADLAAFLAERLAPYKVPRRFRMLKEFPRTGPGKIDKVALKKELTEGAGPKG